MLTSLSSPALTGPVHEWGWATCRPDGLDHRPGVACGGGNNEPCPPGDARACRIRLFLCGGEGCFSVNIVLLIGSMFFHRARLVMNVHAHTTTTTTTIRAGCPGCKRLLWA